jgi:TPR repeat protein
MSADQGFVNGDYAYAHALADGNWCEVDKAQAAHYLKLGADGGYVQCQLEYAVMVDHGDGVPVDKAEAGHYYKLAAAEGKGEGDAMLG